MRLAFIQKCRRAAGVKRAMTREESDSRLSPRGDARRVFLRCLRGPRFLSHADACAAGHYPGTAPGMRPPLTILFLAGAAALLFLLSLGLGPVWLAPDIVAKALFGLGD